MTAITNLIPRPATPGPITDEILERAIAVAAEAETGRLTDDGAALLMFLAQPVMQECLQWRRRMAVIADLAGDNVIVMPGRPS